MLNYTVWFDSEFNAFYLYRIGKTKLGYLPSGIEMPYRRTTLSTIGVMQALNKLSRSELRALRWINDPKDWYDSSALNKSKFLAFQKQLYL